VRGVPITEMTRRDEFNWAAVSPNPCSENLSPPTVKHLCQGASEESRRASV
jgi:hypothetical protein